MADIQCPQTTKDNVDLIFGQLIYQEREILGDEVAEVDDARPVRWLSAEQNNLKENFTQEFHSRRLL